MEDNAIITILDDMRSASRSRITNNLIKIRQQVIATEEGIKQLNTLGGIGLLVSLLHKPNEKIIDLVLSILGNCCMNFECVLEVEKSNGIRPVVHILKNIDKDSILCRACRVIGNIAQFEQTADQLHEFGVVKALCFILNGSTEIPPTNSITAPTKLMAVRALRLLWTGSIRQQEMLAQNAVKAIAMVLIRQKEVWLTNGQEKELLIGVLRCILHITEHPTHDCVVQMIADGTGIQSLVALIPLQPYITVKCVTNLSAVATTRSQLETAEAVRILVERLQAHMNENPSSTWPQDEVSALCLLCRHASTRDDIRNRGGLSILLGIVKHCTNKQQQAQVLHGLLHFIYDDMSLQILLSQGLVTTLIQCFTQRLENMQCQHDTKSSGASTSNKQELDKGSTKRLLKVKRAPELSSETRATNRALKRFRNDCSLDENQTISPKRKYRFENMSSPTDTRLSPQPSNCYSPSCTPPRSYTEEDSDSDDSIRYSPVCSDTESEDEKPNWELKSVNFDNEDFIHYDMGDIELENALDEEIEPKTGEDPTLGWLLVLLSRASFMDEADPALAEANTVTALLRYMQLSSKPVSRAARILFVIISRWDYLMTLLNNKLVLTLHKLILKLPHGETCRQCKEIKMFIRMLNIKLTCVAESGFGKGQIAHVLLRGEETLQQKLIISIPYLIQSRSLLRSLFAHCKGLTMLLNVVSNNELADWEHAVNGLSILAIKLKIKDPKNIDTLKTVHHINCDYHVNLTNKNIALFKLDDDSIVEADRDILTEQSEFFKILLTGHFIESTQEIIQLKNVSNNGLKYLLNILEHNRVAGDTTSFPLCSSLTVALEVIVLSDRFLIENLTDSLIRAIVQHKMSAETIAQIYNWSLESATDMLRIESVAYGLVGVMSEKARCQVFNSIIAEGFYTHLITDIQSLLNRYLKSII